MTENNHSVADVEKIKRWSPVWIIPIVTALIGAWILFYHFSHQGPVVTLVTTTAEGLEAGKTKIKSRSVDVGVVETVTLSDDLSKVMVQARLNAGMEKLLRQDSAFWVVKPQIGREGVSGLGTLLSGAYIELQPGSKGKDGKDNYQLLDAPPLASRTPRGCASCWTARNRASSTPATRCCSAAIASGRWKPATSILKNAPCAISCSLPRLTTSWSPPTYASGKTAAWRSTCRRRACGWRWAR